MRNWIVIAIDSDEKHTAHFASKSHSRSGAIRKAEAMLQAGECVDYVVCELQGFEQIETGK